ncbi:hypothetical protein ACWEBX_03330 [Streptomyces sp. NPDC005070]
MSLHYAVSCDNEGCVALHVAKPRLGRDAAVFAARRAGWDVSTSGLTTRCPSCTTGGLPVMERGNCPTCTGRTHNCRWGETCQYCGHLTPDDEDQEADVEHHQADSDGPAVRTE